MKISNYIQWRQEKVYRDGQLLWQSDDTDPEQVLVESYRHLGTSYPKFFKMDLLSKLAFMTVEMLQARFDPDKKETTAVMLSTYSGSLAVDKKFESGRQEIASPALFVYTLPNIMCGEICIRHGLKGPQICFIEEQFRAQLFWDQLQYFNRHSIAAAYLAGHVEAGGKNGLHADLFWIESSAETTTLPADSVASEDRLQQIVASK